MRVTDERLVKLSNKAKDANAEGWTIDYPLYNHDGALTILDRNGETVVSEGFNPECDYIVEACNSLPDIIADLQDARVEIKQLREYLGLVLLVAKDLNEGIEGLIGLHATHRNHPEMDTEEARAKRGWLIIPSACAATERYDRIIHGENVGCLEDDETNEDREAFMKRLNELRAKVGEL